MLASAQNGFEAKTTFGVIFLIGFMGCGKTTFGRKLAAKLNYPFIDLDEVLEQQAGMAVTDYFSVYGEEKFREMESSVLKNTDYAKNAIVSTGGGLPCFFDNMQWMNNKGKTVYIKMTPHALADRLENGKASRPLLREKKGDELVSFIKDKLDERTFFYEQATWVADGFNISASNMIALLQG